MTDLGHMSGIWTNWSWTINIIVLIYRVFGVFHVLRNIPGIRQTSLPELRKETKHNYSCYAAIWPLDIINFMAKKNIYFICTVMDLNLALQHDKQLILPWWHCTMPVTDCFSLRTVLCTPAWNYCRIDLSPWRAAGLGLARDDSVLSPAGALH